ncbi:sulfide/dihydroorotate dehydrogenase-like FAD/NAD-binding protein [Acidaminobacterium chupaoyuni]
MYKILRREQLSSNVVLMDVDAPLVAKKVLPGQFIILRVNEEGERIPLTVANYDREKGVITIIFQTVGATTMALAELKEGEYIHDFVGPLGTPSETDEFAGKTVAVIGGGLGCAIAWPQAKAIHKAGGTVHMIAGFRSKDIVMLEDQMRADCDHLHMMTDDGTYGEKGLVTAKLEELINSGVKFDAVIAIGPLIMMKFVCLLTKKYDIRTIVSMNPIMIDGTGMCGGCRLTVGGETKFACVDGPDFDGHLVDFDEAIRRSRMYSEQEKTARENHACRMEGMHNGN